MYIPKEFKIKFFFHPGNICTGHTRTRERGMHFDDNLRGAQQTTC